MLVRASFVSLAAALLLATTHGTHAASKNDAARFQRIVVHGESLVGNLAGDSPDRPVSVYLPPSYARQPHRRFPVLYLLHGFTDSDSKWFGLEGKHFVKVPTAADAAFAHGVAEMIVVMPNAFTRYQGSMYGNSAVTGDWETFIARELVRYVDTHYRTLARPESRGLAGHSMGGYGTLRLAMKMPGVFSVIYAMSPCCLAPNSQPDPQMFARAATVRTAEDIAAADFLTKAMLASAAAWSPNPKNPPLYFDLPVVDGNTNPETLAEWTANAPISMFHQYIPALRSYRAMAIDAGDKDEMIAATVVTLHGLLVEYSIPHTFEIYPGDHTNRIDNRLTTLVMPFFGERLQAQSH